MNDSPFRNTPSPGHWETRTIVENLPYNKDRVTYFHRDQYGRVTRTVRIEPSKFHMPEPKS